MMDAQMFTPASQGALSPFAAAMKISPALFAKFQRLIYQAAGIWLSEAKMALLCGRLSRRLRVLSVPTLEEYYQLVSNGTGEEFVFMLDAITTNETHFFREPKHFSFIAEELVPHWKLEAQQGARAQRVRIWSAGCSTGEEPYSLAMLLSKHLPDWDVHILATDISTKVLAEARNGIYKLQKAGEIPSDMLGEFVLQGVNEQEGFIRMKPSLQRMISFQRLNLNEAPYKVADSFDLIFCRNVLIYFDAASKRQTVEALLGHLNPEGLLFLGHSENLNGVTRRVHGVRPTIYQRADIQS
jgi:chemotaxis protein methyltransferase CheR